MQKNIYRKNPDTDVIDNSKIRELMKENRAPMNKYKKP